MRYNLGLSVRYENKAHELTKACNQVMIRRIQAFIWSNSSQIKPTVHAFDMGSAKFPVFTGRSCPGSFSGNLFAIIAEPWPCLYSTRSASEKQAKRVCSLAHKSKNSVLLDLNFTKVYTNTHRGRQTNSQTLTHREIGTNPNKQMRIETYTHAHIHTGTHTDTYTHTFRGILTACFWEIKGNPHGHEEN